MNALETQPNMLPQAKPRFQAGGKLVVLAIVLIAFWAAAISWYFRYQMTHRAAKFWGPESARLIRDAPQVTLYVTPFSGVNAAANPAAAQAIFDKSAIDVSHAPGLTHLRNALLDDRSFEWRGPNEPSPNVADDIAYWYLIFDDPKSGSLAQIAFSHDCRQAARIVKREDGINEVIST